MVSGNRQIPNQLLKYFAYEHLPEKLQVISKPFGDLARLMDSDVVKVQDNDELNKCLAKLLEAKDCAVRSVLP